MSPEDKLTQPCIVCNNKLGHRLHYPHEMMFNSDDIFEYLECGYCGCLQITQIPNNLSEYYPKDGYYSFKPPRQKNLPAWMLHLRSARTRHLLGQKNALGAMLANLTKKESVHFSWFRRGVLTLQSRIVDIGCGAGELLLKLQREGFHNLQGADPFIREDIDYGNGVRILKRAPAELDGTFDFVMLHNSFEHMPDPKGTLSALRRLVAQDGTLLLRIPVADCYARRKYGIHWVQWDAPRHLYLHTVKSIHLLAEQAGFYVSEVTYDSSLFQFASESYLRKPSLNGRGTSPARIKPAPFSLEERKHFSALARELNRQRDGDSACFYLHPC
jgi:2-polyprenyl-3-methyl-5-hydroxy-6-metoxy-1,4-benzoquinol methylase